MNEIHTVETQVYTQLNWALRHTASSAGLCIVKGPVGIGKTHSVTDIVEALRREGINAVFFTCTPTTESNMSAFANGVLAQYGAYERNMVSAVEALENLVLGRPFGTPQRQSILIIDEAQNLKASILTMLRQMYDVGDRARRERSTDVAFGLALVGNNTFMSRGGSKHRANYAPLRDRITLPLNLKQNSKAELEKVASALVPDKDCAEMLCQYAFARGNVRAIALAVREAIGMAEKSDDSLSKKHIEDAITILGGL